MRTLSALMLVALSACASSAPQIQPTQNRDMKSFPYSYNYDGSNFETLGVDYPDRTFDSPDEEKMKRAVRRLIAQRYDCPSTLEKVLSRFGKPFLPPAELEKRMSEDEKKECNSEGDERAILRIQARFNEFPSLLGATLTTAMPYLEDRRTMQASQCEADSDKMVSSRAEYINSYLNSFFLDEDTYWDLLRISRSGKTERLPAKIANGEIELDFMVVETKSPTEISVRIAATKLPPVTGQEFSWSPKSYLVDDQYGPGKANIEQPFGAVLVEQIDLDPLPIKTRQINASWERKAHTNVSVGDYRGIWAADEGYRYCNHRIDVWSNNNVCGNAVETSENGVTVNATLKSGSFIDKWRGWLRFRGELKSISKTATKCQAERAECRHYPTSTQLVVIDPICQRGPGSNEDFEFDDICFREGDVCHYGKVRGDGRCRVTRIERC